MGTGPKLRDLDGGVLKPTIHGPIPSAVDNQLPSIVRSKLREMSDYQQCQFLEEFRRRQKRKRWAYLLWFFLGWHYVYIGKWGVQLLYWFTVGGLWIWAIADLFRIPNLIRDFNSRVALDVLKDMRSIHD